MHGPITEQMSSLVTAQLLFLESEDPERPINMYINRFVRVANSVSPARIYRGVLGHPKNTFYRTRKRCGTWHVERGVMYVVMNCTRQLLQSLMGLGCNCCI